MDDHRITYVGPPEVHDGHLLSVERLGDRAIVRVRSYEGNEFSLEFTGVSQLIAVRPEGMLLYGLAQLETSDAARQFIFANWEEWDDAGLEITARDFRVLPAAVGATAEPRDRVG